MAATVTPKTRKRFARSLAALWVVPATAALFIGVLPNITATPAAAATGTCTTKHGVVTCIGSMQIATSKATDHETTSTRVVSNGNVTVLLNEFLISLAQQAQALKEGNCYWMPQGWNSATVPGTTIRKWFKDYNLHVCKVPKTKAIPYGLVKIGGGKTGKDCRNAVRPFNQPPPVSEQVSGNVELVDHATDTVYAVIYLTSTVTATAKATVSVHNADHSCRASASAFGQGIGTANTSASAEGTSTSNAISKAKGNLAKKIAATHTDAKAKASAQARDDLSSNAWATARASCTSSTTTTKKPVKTTVPLTIVRLKKVALGLNGQSIAGIFRFMVTVNGRSYGQTLLSPTMVLGSYPFGTHVSVSELVNHNWVAVSPKKYGIAESAVVGKKPIEFVFTDKKKLPPKAPPAPVVKVVTVTATASASASATVSCPDGTTASAKATASASATFTASTYTLAYQKAHMEALTTATASASARASASAKAKCGSTPPPTTTTTVPPVTTVTATATATASASATVSCPDGTSASARASASATATATAATYALALQEAQQAAQTQANSDASASANASAVANCGSSPPPASPLLVAITTLNDVDAGGQSPGFCVTAQEPGVGGTLTISALYGGFSTNGPVAASTLSWSLLGGTTTECMTYYAPSEVPVNSTGEDTVTETLVANNNSTPVQEQQSFLIDPPNPGR